MLKIMGQACRPESGMASAARRAACLEKRGVMRRLSLAFATAAVLLFGVLPGLAAGGSHKDAGEESAELQESIEWFTDQRMAPGFVNPNAYAAAIAQGVLLPST